MARLCRCGKICEDTFGSDGHGSCKCRASDSTQPHSVGDDDWSHSRKIMLYNLGDPQVLAELEATRAFMEEWYSKRMATMFVSNTRACNG
jgi:hypothetical protein